MARIRITASIATAALGLLVSGCASTGGNTNPMEMKAPPRPAELDRLDAMVGKWDMTFSCKMGDQEMKGSGTGNSAWDADKSILVERGEGTMGDSPKWSMLGVWTWDAKAGKYYNYGFDNMGEVGESTATYDEANKTWKIKGSGRNTMTGQKSYSEGKLVMVDSNTMTWDFTQWDSSLKFKKIMEMSGTSKKK